MAAPDATPYARQSESCRSRSVLSGSPAGARRGRLQTNRSRYRPAGNKALQRFCILRWLVRTCVLMMDHSLEKLSDNISLFGAVRFADGPINQIRFRKRILVS